MKIDARNSWTGVKERDDHLRSADFLDVEQHPEITFNGNQVEIRGEHDYAVTGDLTIRGVTRQVCLDVSYLGAWETPSAPEITRKMRVPLPQLSDPSRATLFE